MRTTVTLDADVEQLLRARMRRTNRSFTETLNQAIRNGLSDDHPEGSVEPFQVRPRNMGLRTGIDPVNLSKLSDGLEAEAFLEIAERKEPYSRDRS